MSLDAFVEKKSGHSQKVSEAEIKLSSFFAHHKVAFEVVDHLISILKDSFPDSNILKDVKLRRTKTTSVIKNVIAKKESEDLAVVLQQNFFSVLIDESTDISANKLLGVNVKFVNNSGLACDRLLKVISVDAKNANAENLYTAFKECLISQNIPIKNVIGLACDNASVMLGKNNSFLTRLRKCLDSLTMYLPFISTCCEQCLFKVASNAGRICKKYCQLFFLFFKKNSSAYVNATSFKLNKKNVEIVNNKVAFDPAFCTKSFG
ncbi:unnamed protein product [Acanthoscelides obtectus]|uniref:DUF4371 domain-containing protein n=1 Tax=Acanthoscelides obtectus TaxID=200917 RepID=A0A9P0NVW4_ACAOB|nr:unnamed protein product [Acanthoscelides obtectus]CAK1671257.1 hypothetical protein AOBTE_LOCUS28192 [Acanthoscelides obtectus]